MVEYEEEDEITEEQEDLLRLARRVICGERKDA
jgi:hypothetical protein